MWTLKKKYFKIWDTENFSLLRANQNMKKIFSQIKADFRIVFYTTNPSLKKLKCRKSIYFHLNSCCKNWVLDYWTIECIFADT